MLILVAFAALSVAQGQPPRDNPAAQSYRERFTSASNFKSCLERHLAEVPHSDPLAKRAAKLRARCEAEAAEDLRTWVKWNGDRASVRIATENSKRR